MSDSVLGALITAGASILIAIINKISTPSERDGSPKRSPAQRGTPQVAISATTQEEAPQAPARAWYISLGILLVWMALSPALVHHDFAGMNFYLIPIVVIPLALIVPIPPLKAAWMSLAMFAANFVIGPMSNRLHGSAYDTTFVGGNAREETIFLEFLLLVGGGTAAAASGICLLRRKYGGAGMLSGRTEIRRVWQRNLKSLSICEPRELCPRRNSSVRRRSCWNCLLLPTVAPGRNPALTGPSCQNLFSSIHENH
jgi:hypothetical protein